MNINYQDEVEAKKGDTIREDRYFNTKHHITNYYSFCAYNNRPDYIDVYTIEGSKISIKLSNCCIEKNKLFYYIKPIESKDHK